MVNMLKEYTIENVGTYGCIYKLTSSSGKCYIGQSWNIKNRISKYKYITEKSRQYKIYYAIIKYGFNKFNVEIIDLAENQTEMDNKECFYIELYDSVNLGYNIEYGGKSNGKINENSKKILSKKFSGNGNPFYGKCHTNYTKKLISESNKGRIVSNETRIKLSIIGKNKIVSLETKQKMSIARKNVKLSEYTKQKIRNISKNNFNDPIKSKIIIHNMIESHSKNLYEITTPSGEIIITKYLKKYCKENNLHSSAMYNVIKGKYNHHKGYKVKKF